VSEADFLVKVRDGAAMIADACGERLEKLRPRQNEPVWSPEKIVWQPSQGDKGPFEKCTDFQNKEYSAMLTDINNHMGAMYRDSTFYWVFPDGRTVGKKPK